MRTIQNTGKRVTFVTTTVFSCCQIKKKRCIRKTRLSLRMLVFVGEMHDFACENHGATSVHVSIWWSWTCQDVFGYTSLALASSVGHEGVVNLLLAGSTDQSVCHSKHVPNRSKNVLLFPPGTYQGSSGRELVWQLLQMMQSIPVPRARPTRKCVATLETHLSIWHLEQAMHSHALPYVDDCE